jgi:hypothetical protein
LSGYRHDLREDKMEATLTQGGAMEGGREKDPVRRAMGCGAFAGAVTGILIGLHEGLRLLYAWNGYDFLVLRLIVVAGIALGLTALNSLAFGAVEWLLRRVLPFLETKGRAADTETSSRYCSPPGHAVAAWRLRQENKP